MIDDLIKAFREAGMTIPENIERQVQDRLRATFGGTEVYVPKLRHENKARIHEFGTSVPAHFVARKLGCTVGHVYRIRRLLKPQ